MRGLEEAARIPTFHSCSFLCLLGVTLCLPGRTHAQAGPPFLSNDPGTPGNGNWEINLAAAPTIARDVSSYQIPQIDLNYGLSERIQLSYQVPYVVQTSSGEPQHSAWGNAYSGVKWRFLDQEEGGWQMSTFPQVETAASSLAEQRGIATPGPRLLLPIEVAKKVGDYDLDMEAGYYFPKNGAHERILGLVMGRSVTERLELDAEIYDDRAVDAPPSQTTPDVGGRYKLARRFIALFMAGRTISGTANGQPEFMGYCGIQILLGNYGRSLAAER